MLDINLRQGRGKTFSTSYEILKLKPNVDGNKARELEIQGSKEDMKVPT